MPVPVSAHLAWLADRVRARGLLACSASYGESRELVTSAAMDSHGVGFGDASKKHLGFRFQGHFSFVLEAEAASRGRC